MIQIRQKTPGKQIAIILDNASIHKSGKVKKYLDRYPRIKPFYLPTYSPEYNPVELFWKWIKPKVYGFSALGGLSELITRFRKLVWHYNRGMLHNPIQFNFKAYELLL
jgi:transposase